jgi:hypothetical protein
MSSTGLLERSFGVISGGAGGPVPKMLRVISRPITVPAERIALLNAGLFVIFSNIEGSAVSRDFTSP